MATHAALTMNRCKRMRYYFYKKLGIFEPFVFSQQTFSRQIYIEEEVRASSRLNASARFLERFKVQNTLIANTHCLFQSKSTSHSKQQDNDL